MKLKRLCSHRFVSVYLLRRHVKGSEVVGVGWGQEVRVREGRKIGWKVGWWRVRWGWWRVRRGIELVFT